MTPPFMAESEEELKSLLMKVKSESEVAQSCLTLRDPTDCSLPGSSVHGIFEARVLEWGAILRQMLKYCIYLKFPTIDSKKEKSYCTALSRSVSKFKKQVIFFLSYS